MKLALLVLAGVGWWWKQKLNLRLGSLAGILWLGGLGTLLFGASFVAGAVEEKEPEAALASSKLFGGLGLGLIALASLIGGQRKLG